MTGLGGSTGAGGYWGWAAPRNLCLGCIGYCEDGIIPAAELHMNKVTPTTSALTGQSSHLPQPGPGDHLRHPHLGSVAERGGEGEDLLEEAGLLLLLPVAQVPVLEAGHQVPDQPAPRPPPEVGHVHHDGTI